MALISLISSSFSGFNFIDFSSKLGCVWFYELNGVDLVESFGFLFFVLFSVFWFLKTYLWLLFGFIFCEFVVRLLALGRRKRNLGVVLVVCRRDVWFWLDIDWYHLFWCSAFGMLCRWMVCLIWGRIEEKKGKEKERNLFVWVWLSEENEIDGGYLKNGSFWSEMSSSGSEHVWMMFFIGNVV